MLFYSVKERYLFLPIGFLWHRLTFIITHNYCVKRPAALHSSTRGAFLRKFKKKEKKK